MTDKDKEQISHESVEQQLNYSRGAVQPSIQGALTLKKVFPDLGQLGAGELVTALSDQCQCVSSTSEGTSEILAGQAITLDAIYHRLARQALKSDGLDVMEALLQLALRAQKQSASALEAISRVKNPPIRQTNIAHQQINNVAGEKSPNELLEVDDEKRLDSTKKTAAGRYYQEAQTVGEIDGTQD